MSWGRNLEALTAGLKLGPWEGARLSWYQPGQRNPTPGSLGKKGNVVAHTAGRPGVEVHPGSKAPCLHCTMHPCFSASTRCPYSSISGKLSADYHGAKPRNSVSPISSPQERGPLFHPQEDLNRPSLVTCPPSRPGAVSRRGRVEESMLGR